MRRPAVLWILALLITLASAVYQRMTGPSYPVRGKTKVSGTEVSYRLIRTQDSDADADVRIPAADASIRGQIAWKRFKTDDAWTYVTMAREGGELTGKLPKQPPAGKLLYRVILEKDEERVSLGGAPVVIRFKGPVPMPILSVHIFCMFVGMLLSNRAALETLRPAPEYRRLILLTIALLTVGGLILGPVVQKYAFGAYWTGWPLGNDLTDNKTAVAWLAWVIAWVALRRSARPSRWVICAGVITLVVFAIPHSLLGSELDYAKAAGGAK